MTKEERLNKIKERRDAKKRERIRREEAALENYIKENWTKPLFSLSSKYPNGHFSIAEGFKLAEDFAKNLPSVSAFDSNDPFERSLETAFFWALMDAHVYDAFQMECEW